MSILTINTTLQKSIITNVFSIPKKLVPTILDKYFLRKWQASYYTKQVLPNNSKDRLVYQGIGYKVIYYNTNSFKLKCAEKDTQILLSFRKPKDTSIHPIVLIKPYK